MGFVVCMCVCVCVSEIECLGFSLQLGLISTLLNGGMHIFILVDTIILNLYKQWQINCVWFHLNRYMYLVQGKRRSLCVCVRACESQGGKIILFFCFHSLY